MSKKTSGLIKVDFLKMNSLTELVEYAKQTAAEEKLKEENELFNHFVETGEVVESTTNEKDPVLKSLADMTSLLRPGPLLKKE